MKIIVRNSDNRVLFSGDDLTLTDSGVAGNGWRYDGLNTATATLVDATLPNVFSGGVYSFDGTTWTIVDQTRYDELVLDAKKTARSAAKAARAAAVEAITVTTSAGHTFNGDETSQTRMARAILALNAQPQTPVPTVVWVLADNTPAAVTAAELTEALALSGAAQAAVWVI